MHNEYIHTYFIYYSISFLTRAFGIWYGIHAPSANFAGPPTFFARPYLCFQGHLKQVEACARFFFVLFWHVDLTKSYHVAFSSEVVPAAMQAFILHINDVV